MRFAVALLVCLAPMPGRAVAEDAAEARSRFAAIMIEAIAASDSKVELRYDAENFALVGKDVNFYLDRAFANYLQAAATDRAEIVRRFSGALVEGGNFTAAWDKVRTRIFPVVRPRFSFLMTTPDGTAIRLPTAPLGKRYSVALVEDRPDSMAYVSDSVLKDWGVDFEQALAAARANLKRVKGEFGEVQDGVYVGGWEDGYNVSRLLLTSAIAKLPLKGDPVAFVPTRTLLILTGSENENGLGIGAQALTDYRENADALLGVALRLDGATRSWMPYEPKKTSDTHLLLRQIDILGRRSEFGQQKEFLDAKLKGVDIFVASYLVLRNSKEEMIGLSSWSKGIRSLLPRTDRISLVDPDIPGDAGVLGMVPFEAFREICPERLVQSDKYADRWVTNGFPDADQLKKLLARGE